MNWKTGLCKQVRTLHPEIDLAITTCRVSGHATDQIRHMVTLHAQMEAYDCHQALAHDVIWG